MKVRRLFFVLHIPAGKGKGLRKLSEDFPIGKPLDECKKIIYSKYGKRDVDSVRSQLNDFAEVTHATITEDKREIEQPFKTPKHFGSGLLFNPIDYANMEDITKVNRKKRKTV